MAKKFAEAGLFEAARSGAPLSPTELETHLLSEVNQFCHSQLQDDATLLVIAAEAATGQARGISSWLPATTGGRMARRWEPGGEPGVPEQPVARS
jgi:hypothetical protein